MKHLFAITLALLLCLAPVASSSPRQNPFHRTWPSATAFAEALRQWKGSSAPIRFRHFPASKPFRVHGEWVRDVKQGEFWAQVNGPGGIAASWQVFKALGHIARGSRKPSDLRNGPRALLHELDHSVGPNRHRPASSLTQAELDAEEKRAEQQAGVDLQILLSQK